MYPVQQRTGIAAPLVLAATLSLAACGSVPKPTAELASATTALDSARQSSAGEAAPVTLDRARAQLEEAERAAAQDDNEKARRLAELAAVNAELARTQSEQARTESAAIELQKGIAALQSETSKRVR